MASTNLVDADSPGSFQETLSKDLNRVSVIYFWAPWAEPCKQMNEVVKELALKHPNVLFVKVEAEQQEEITDSFDIEAVPAYVVLRGHTLLDRINGADATKLSSTVAKYDTKLAYTPLSKTDNAPAKPTNILPTELDNTKEPQEDLQAKLRGLMNQSKVVLFMKGSPDAPRCGFSRKISTLLKEQEVDFTHFDILTDESVRQGLKVLNDWPTFPQLIVKGELVGGLDIVQEMASTGELKEAVV